MSKHPDGNCPDDDILLARSLARVLLDVHPAGKGHHLMAGVSLVIGQGNDDVRAAIAAIVEGWPSETGEGRVALERRLHEAVVRLDRLHLLYDELMMQGCRKGPAVTAAEHRLYDVVREAVVRAVTDFKVIEALRTMLVKLWGRRS